MNSPQVKQFMTHLKTLGTSSGTWTWSLASNVPILTRSQAAATPIIEATFGASVPTSDSISNSSSKKIKTVKFKYKVATLALAAAPTMTLYALTRVGDGVDTAASVTGTLAITGDNTVGTAVGEYVATFTVTTPTFVDSVVDYSMQIAVNCAATSDLIIERGVEWTYETY
jgi:hypothetical protein